jgi:hypothetical protein
MYGVPQAGLTVPAVAGQLERGVRRHLVRSPRVDKDRDLWRCSAQRNAYKEPERTYCRDVHATGSSCLQSSSNCLVLCLPCSALLENGSFSLLLASIYLISKHVQLGEADRGCAARLRRRSTRVA